LRLPPLSYLLIKQIGGNTMIKVTVTIKYQGKNYVTNVITDKEANEDTIRELAFEQVKKQWAC
jgi:hypothetical protein